MRQDTENIDENWDTENRDEEIYTLADGIAGGITPRILYCKNSEEKKFLTKVPARINSALCK